MNGTIIANQYVYDKGTRDINTVITFDNGAQWYLLEAPESAAGGSKTYCELVGFSNLYTY